MKPILFFILLSFSVSACLPTIQKKFELPASSLTLSNGETFELWEDQTTYKKIYYVNNQNPIASDSNPGTLDYPFKTISKAANVVKAGEKVIVKSGVYRESVRLKHSGKNKKLMIHYAAAQGEEVTVKGSALVKQKWTKINDNLWKIKTPGLIKKLTQQDNLLPAQVEHMPWAKKTLGKAPYNHSPLLIFRDGKRMRQTGSKKSLESSNDVYFVDKLNKEIFISSEKPEEHQYEIAFIESLFKPQKLGTSFIRVSGFIFEHAANRFPRAQVGAVSSYVGENWIFENNTIRNVNSICLDVGTGWAWERPLYSNVGSHQITGNHIYQCGVSGISGHRVKNLLIADNTIEDIGWHDVERFWETGAIKLHLPEYSLIAHNKIKNINGSPAIWLDFLPVHSRVTNNYIENTTSIAGAIVVEAAQEINIVDRNIVLQTEGNAVYQRDSDKTHIEDNIFIGIEGNALLSTVPRKREVGGRDSTSVLNIFQRNIIFDYRDKVFFKQINNISKDNIWINLYD